MSSKAVQLKSACNCFVLGIGKPTAISQGIWLQQQSRVWKPAVNSVWKSVICPVPYPQYKFTFTFFFLPYFLVFWVNWKLPVRKKVIWIVTVSGNWGMRNFRACWWAASFSNGFGSQQHCKSWLCMGCLDIIRNICSICKYLCPDKGVQTSRYL